MINEISLEEFAKACSVSPQADGNIQVSFPIFGGSKICFVNDCPAPADKAIEDAYYYVKGIIVGDENSDRAYVREPGFPILNN